jgi:molecular chaperone GrpE
MQSSPGSSPSGHEEHVPPAPDGGARPGVAEQQPGRQPEQQGDDTVRELELQDQVARLEDRYRRSLADLDNYRKRSVREMERRVQEARDALLREWLEALDSVERALRMESGGTLAEGMQAVLEQMEAILARHGVQRLGAVGEQFDPERHEAVGVRETDEVPDRTVVEVVRSGFAAGDRVLRPAQVIVSRRPPAPEG